MLNHGIYCLSGLSSTTKMEEIQLERRSTENMLIFYEREMHLIEGGAKASLLLSKSLVRNFMDIGVLDYSSRLGARRVILTKKGRELYGLNPIDGK